MPPTLAARPLYFTETDLAATVAAYNPTLHEAPLIIGHPQHDAPAAGWVKSLSATTALIAEPQQIDTSFAEQIAKGSYKKISASRRSVFVRTRFSGASLLAMRWWPLPQ